MGGHITYNIVIPSVTSLADKLDPMRSQRAILMNGPHTNWIVLVEIGTIFSANSIAGNTRDFRDFQAVFP